MKYVLVALILFATLLEGSRAESKQNGNICHAAAAELSKIGRNQYGVHNASTTSAASVWCPIERRTLNSSDNEGPTINLEVKYYDRNSSSDVECTLMMFDVAGNAVWSSTRSSNGVNDASSHALLFAPPYDHGALETNNMLINCSIPPAQNGSVSHIASVYWNGAFL